MPSEAALVAAPTGDLKIRTPILREVVAYWDAKRAGRPFPSRRDIDAVELGSLLPFLMLIDVEPTDGAPRFRFRLVGTSVCRHYGADYTGRRLDELDMDGHGPVILEQYASVVRERRPRCDVLRYIMERGRARAYERVLLPLSEDGATVGTLLGAQFELSAPGSARSSVPPFPS